MQTEEKGILPLYENRKGVFTCQKKKDLTFPPRLCGAGRNLDGGRRHPVSAPLRRLCRGVSRQNPQL